MGFLYLYPIFITSLISFCWSIYLVYNTHVRRKKKKKENLGTSTIHFPTLINVRSMMVQQCFDHTSSYVQGWVLVIWNITKQVRNALSVVCPPYRFGKHQGDINTLKREWMLLSTGNDYSYSMLILSSIKSKGKTIASFASTCNIKRQ